MEERRIRRLALLALIIGLTVMSWLAWGRWSSPADDLSVASVRGKDPSELVGAKVSVAGEVVQVRKHGKVSFLKISPMSPYPLVSFVDLDVKPKEKVRVTGKVKLYKGQAEVMIDKVARTG